MAIALSLKGVQNQLSEKDNPLFSVLSPAVYESDGQYVLGKGPAVGNVAIKDTGKVNRFLNMPEIKAIFPSQVRFLWTAKAYDEDGKYLQLIAIKVNNREGRAPLEGDVIVDAFQSFGQFGGKPEITM